MTLREEPGSGPPADRETRTDPREPAATPAAEDHVSPAGPGPGTGVAPPEGPGHPAGSGGPGGRGSPPRRRRSRAAFLIGGSVAVCLAGLGGLATVLLLHARTQRPGPAAPPSVFRLSVGECVDASRGAISSPKVVPCRRPHDAEVYARFGLAGQHWPGTAAVETRARQGCAARLSGYLNPQLATTVLAQSYVFPNRTAWNAGVRTVVCEIRGTNGRLTGSVRGLG